MIILAKIFLVLKRFIAAFLFYCFYKPLRIVLRFLFYKVVVKIYGLYFTFLKKVGWTGLEKTPAAVILKQKLVHILVIVISTLLIFINFSTKTRADDLTDMAHKTILADLIQSELSGFEEDEQLIVETFDKEMAISSIQQNYLDNLSSMRPQVKVNMDEEDEEDEAVTIQNGTSLVKPDIAKTTMTKRARENNVEYIIKSGDSISTIAEEFEISVSTILWENNLNSYSIIKPGQKLIILPVSGVTHKVASGDNLSSIAKKYKIEEEVIAKTNKLTSTSKLAVGQELLIPGGTKSGYAASQSTGYTGYTAITNLVKEPNASPVAGNKMNWPTEGHRITQYYSWRHYGLDIANKIGTPIYAADAGTIETAGWGTGYGNQIVVNHGGGKKTRYAHLSSFYVKVGDKVSKGQAIGEMGSTGWSTGPHLHFEVIINNKKYNPLNYIK